VPDRGAAAAERVAELVGQALGWDEERRSREVASFHDRIAADRRSEAEPTDAAAIAARTAPRDLEPSIG
jgi:glycerol-3-phosphate dehydrogenase